MGTFIHFNGVLLPSGEPVLRADNPGFRYGDGLFETMRTLQGRIILGSYHFNRLWAGLRLLQFELPLSPEKLAEEVRELCEKNGHTAHARVRLVVFRNEEGGGRIIGSEPMEAWDDSFSGPEKGTEEGLRLDLFPGGRKSCDTFSHLKSNNYLLYSMAARYAREWGLGDCLVLNSHGRIAESSIANIFYCRKGKIHTPPLSEGCIDGIMRRYLMTIAKAAGFVVEEKAMTPEELEEAEEVFLTNAIRGIRPVRQFRQSAYTHTLTQTLSNELRRALRREYP